MASRQRHGHVPNLDRALRGVRGRAAHPGFMRTIASFIVSAAALGLLVGGTAGAQGNAACDRGCLEGFVDRYLDALIKHDPSAAPLASNVRYTENGQRLAIGDGLWRSMKAKGTYRLFVSDVEAGQVVLLGTMHEEHANPAQTAPALIALRLKVTREQIVEVEMEIARSADAAQRVEALGTPHALFTQPIPANERMSRADLIKTADMYFTGMQQNDGKGDYPFADDCNRIENGMQTTNRSTPSGRDAARSRRRFQLLRAVELPRAILVRPAAFCESHTRPPLRGGGSRARARARVRVLRPLRRRHATLHDAFRSSSDGWSCATVDVVHRRAVSRRERQAAPDRSRARARALRHDVRLELMGRRHVGPCPRRDPLRRLRRTPFPPVSPASHYRFAVLQPRRRLTSHS